MKEIRTFLALTLRSALPILLLAAAVLYLRPGLAPAARSQAELPAVPAPAREPLPEEALPAMAPSDPEVPVPEEGPVPLPDRDVRLSLLTARGTMELSLEEYLPGVLAAEMPASFPPEALKAQAVAARTDTLWRLRHDTPHPLGTCCADPACCKAWFSEEEQRRRWGGDYDRWHEAVTRAVADTDGLVLLYEDEPILAVFHACSPGQTEASEDVWVEALPYLRSVTSPETGENVQDYYGVLSLSWSEVRRIAASVPGADLSGPEEEWLSGAVYSPAGRLRAVRFGGVLLTGVRLRSLFGLRSTAVTWTAEAEGLRFTTAGYGHGVGMSQQGARLMALEGADYGEILAHYYPGAALGSLPPGTPYSPG